MNADVSFWTTCGIISPWPILVLPTSMGQGRILKEGKKDDK
ncbi:MAG: hypothetical protein RXP30_04490 [Thermoplasmata archaeon]|jgi:hypothetical protein